MTAFARVLRSGFALLLLGLLALPARAAIDIERVVSPGGIEAWLVRDEKNPIIAVQFAFDGGTELDPAGKYGLATMVSALLDEGAGDLNSQAFQKRLEDNSVSLGFSAGRDGFFGSLTTLTETRDTAFDLLRLALTRPRFDADAVERMRSQLTASLKRSLSDPGYVSQLTFAETVFGDHPYAKPASGTLETLSAITRDDLKGFVAARLGRDRLKIAVAGDITAAELGKVLDRVFGGLPAKAAPFQVPEIVPKGAGAVIAAPRPIPQTLMLMGLPGIKRDDPDWFAATVLNYVLGGGGFSSRLMEEVREKRGLTYGVSSGLQAFDHAGLMVVSGSTSNDKAAQAIDLIRQILGDVGKAGITRKELDDAKTYLTGSFPLQFTSNRAIAGILLSVQRDGLGIDYLNRRNGLIEAVTLEDVQRVARRLLDPARLAIVLVGQPDGIRPTATVSGDRS